jgi:hypothetical protein
MELHGCDIATYVRVREDEEATVLKSLRVQVELGSIMTVADIRNDARNIVFDEISTQGNAKKGHAQNYERRLSTYVKCERKKEGRPLGM